MKGKTVKEIISIFLVILTLVGSMFNFIDVHSQFNEDPTALSDTVTEPQSIISQHSIPGNIITTASTTSIVLAFDAVNEAISYEVEVDGETINIGNNVLYEHSGLEPETEHSYRVRSVNQNGFSKWSELVSIATLPCIIGIPDNLASAATNNSITITWDSVQGVTGYDVEADGTIVDIGLNNSYTLGELSENTEHAFKIRAKNESVVGAWSNTLDVTTEKVAINDNIVDTAMQPAIPGNVTGIASAESIEVTWDAVEGAIEYDIEVDGTIVENGQATSYIHKLSEDSIYHNFRVRAKNKMLSGNWSSLITITATPDETSLYLLSPLNVKIFTGDNSINVVWEAVYTAVYAADVYDIEIDGSVINDVINMEYTHSNPTPDVEHGYRVRAKCGELVGEWSEICYGVLIGLPTLTVKSFDDKHITLAWNCIEANDEYEIEVDGEIIKVGKEHEFTHKDLMPGTQHVYRIRVKKGMPDKTKAFAISTKETDSNLEITESMWSEKLILSTLDASPAINGEWYAKQYMMTSVRALGLVASNGKLYALGGKYDASAYTKLEEYNPSTNTWAYKTDMPTAHAYLGTAAVNGKIYAIGGTKSGTDYLKSIEEYNPATNTWTTKADMPTARYGLGAAVVNGKIYAIGGKASGGYSKKVEEYNPATNTWTTKADMPTARQYLGVVALNGKIYAIGGYNGTVSNIIEEYDPATNTWVSKAYMSAARQHIGVTSSNGRIFIIGGNTGSGYTALSEEYDPVSNTFYTLPYMPQIRGESGVAELNNNIYVVGGMYSYPISTTEMLLLAVPSNIPPAPVNVVTTGTATSISINWNPLGNIKSYDIEVDGSIINTGTSNTYKHNSLVANTQHKYRVRAKNIAGVGPWSTEKVQSTTNPANHITTGQWSMKKNKPVTTRGLGLVAANGKLYAVGGKSDASPFTRLDEYNPSTDTWASKASLPTARAYLGASAINGKIYAIGGTKSGTDYLKSMDEYDTATNTWTAKADMPTARYGLGAAVVNGKIYAIGGKASGGYSKKVEEYNPATNTWTTKADMPTARQYLGVVALNGKIYAIGGYNGTVSNIIEEYDPAANTWVSKAYMPDARQQIGVTASNGRIFIIGGNTSSGYTALSEEYDPVSNTFYTLPYMSEGRVELGITELNNNIYAVGGVRTYPISTMEMLPLNVPSQPAIPTNLATTSTSNSIKLTWSLASNATEYEVEVDGSIVNIGGVNSYTHNNLAPNSTHIYRVRSKNFLYTSNWSAQISSITAPAIPTGITTVSNYNSINIAWGSVSGATGYEIEVDGAVINNNANVSYLHNSLQPGTQHKYRVRSKNTGGLSDWSLERVVFTLPAIPTNITAKGTESTISLAWGQVSGVTGYDIEENGIVIVSNLNQIQYSRSGLASNTSLIYRIRSRNTGGTSDWSASVNTRTLPAIPSGISTTVTESSVTLLWNASVGATGYDIQCNSIIVGNDIKTSSFTHGGLQPYSIYEFKLRSRVGSSAGNWSAVVSARTTPGVPDNISATSNESSITVSWANAESGDKYDVEADGIVIASDIPWTSSRTNYSHTGLQSNSSHRYRVRSKKYGLASRWSPEFTYMTSPAVPSFTIDTVLNDNITISWGSVVGAIGYDVSINNAAAIDVGNSLRYTNGGLNPNQTYSYRVRSKNSFGSSNWTNGQSKKTGPPIPNSISTIATEQSITLTWGASLGASEGYEIEADGIVHDNGTNLSFLHSPLLPGTQHIYRLKSKNESASSNWSTEVVVCTIPTVPANVGATAYDDSIIINWDMVTGANGYDIEADGEIIASNITQNSFMHDGLLSGTSHNYRVRSRNASGYGSWSDEVRASVIPSIPNNITTITTNNSITVNWEAVAGATGYDIEADSDIYNNGNSVSFIHNDIVSGTQHSYRVRSRNDGGNSLWSPEVVAFASPAIPSVTEISSTSDSITLVWTELSPDASYDIDADGQIIDNGLSETYIHTGLTPGTEHKYKLMAKFPWGQSSWSQEYIAKTAPAVPSGILTFSTDNNIKLVWNEVYEATEIEVEIDGASLIAIGNTNTYTHNDLQAGEEHRYRIRAMNDFGSSVWSDIVIAETIPAIPVITNAIPDYNRITINWNSVSGAKGYEVEVNGIIKGEVTDTSYIDSDLSNGIVYEYRIRSKNSGGASPWTVSLRQGTLIRGEWIQLENQPTAKKEIAAAAIEDKIYIIGNNSNIYNPNTLEEFDTKTGQWSDKTSMPVYLSGFDAVQVNNKIYVLGGDTYFGVYDPETDSWNRKASSPSVAYDAGLAVLDGKIYACGGRNNSSTYLKSLSVYDPATNSWTIKADMPTAREKLGVIASGGKLYAIGGYNDTSLNTIEVYDPVTDQWSQITSSLAKRNDFGISEANGKIFLTGGKINTNILDTVEQYDPISNSVQTETGMPTKRHGLKSVISDGKIYAFGGKETYADLNIVEAFILSLPQNIPTTPVNERTIATEDEISVNWEEVRFATAYELEIDGGIKSTTENSYLISNLSPNTVHNIKVRSRNISGTSDWSAGITQSTADINDKISGIWTTGAGMIYGREHAAYVTLNGKIYAIGGQNKNGPLKTVEEYDPKTNSWTIKADMNHERYVLAAVAVDNKIYAIGGINKTGVVDYIEEYDPLTDTWTDKTNAPIARAGLCAVESGGRIYALGGFSIVNGNNIALDDVQIYDPIMDTWTSTENMLVERSNFGAAVINDKILIYGGVNSDSANTIDEFDLVTNSWRIKADLKVRRYGFASCVLNNKIFIIGATDYLSSNLVEEYDPDKNSLVMLANVPTGRHSLGAAAVEGKIVAVGGAGSSYLDHYQNTVEVYKSTLSDMIPYAPTKVQIYGTKDSVDIKWKTVEDATGYDIEIDGVVTSIGANAFYIHSGLAPKSQHSYRIRSKNAHGTSPWSGEYLQITADPTTEIIGEWSGKANALTGRYGLSAAAVNGKIYSIGGFNSAALSTVEEYDPEADKWITKTSMPTARGYFGVVENDSKLYVIGGTAGTNSCISYNEVYDPAADTWITKKHMSISRSGAGYAAVNGKIYAIGGDIYGLCEDSIEEYDPSTDTWDYKADMPSFRKYFGTAAVNGKIYAIGGTNGEKILDTIEEYDPVLDKWTTKQSLPKAKYGFGVAVINGKIMMFGGKDNNGNIDTVEEYDPINNTFITKQSLSVKKSDMGIALVDSKIYTIAGNSGSLTNNTDAYIIANSSNIPGIPQNARIKDVKHDQLSIIWDPVLNATGYQVEMDGQVIATIQNTSYLSIGLTPGSTHKYRVSAKNVSGVGEWSAELTVTTQNSQYIINCTNGEEIDLHLTVSDSESVGQYIYTIKYNTNELSVLDLYSPSQKADLAVGLIEDTAITITQFTPGTIILKLNKTLEAKQTWTGLVIGIKFKSKLSGQSAVIYTVQ